MLDLSGRTRNDISILTSAIDIISAPYFLHIFRTILDRAKLRLYLESVASNNLEKCQNRENARK